MKELCKKPDSSSWSLGQVYMHLIDETTWYFDQIELCLGTSENSDKQMTETAKITFLNNAFPNEIIKGDPFISDKVKQPKNIDSLKKAFQQLKARGNDIWKKIEKSETQGKSRHPGLQFFSSIEWFQYAEMHLRHHLRQKNRIDNFLNSSTA